MVAFGCIMRGPREIWIMRRPREIWWSLSAISRSTSFYALGFINAAVFHYRPRGNWEAARALSSHAISGILAVRQIKFQKLPPCINPSSLPNLSHLDLWLVHMYEQGLRILSRLPELCFLRLELECSATIRSHAVGDSEAAVYFPNLRFCELLGSCSL